MTATEDRDVHNAVGMEVDAVVVGAGVAGLYAVHKLGGLGLTVVGIEAGDGVGGTWFWNRYPGCRCDVPSLEYSYGFSRELQLDWEWTEVMPGRAENMGDGWETKRRRGPGYDWIIVKLGLRGEIRKVEVDTNHFKGNYPDMCSIDGCDACLSCDGRQVWVLPDDTAAGFSLSLEAGWVSPSYGVKVPSKSRNSASARRPRR